MVLRQPTTSLSIFQFQDSPTASPLIPKCPWTPGETRASSSSITSPSAGPSSCRSPWACSSRPARKRCTQNPRTIIAWRRTRWPPWSTGARARRVAASRRTCWWSLPSAPRSSTSPISVPKWPILKQLPRAYQPDTLWPSWGDLFKVKMGRGRIEIARSNT